MNCGFFVRHFTERGTEVSIYDYAKYNEEILHNKSVILCFTPAKQRAIGFPTERHSYEKFKARFLIIELNDISDIALIIKMCNLTHFYTQTYGGLGDVYQFSNKAIWSGCKTIKHCVFDTRGKEADVYISISHHLNRKLNTDVPVVPYIVDLPSVSDDLREKLKIPGDAIVIGRHGGYGTFDIPMTHAAIIDFLKTNTNTYFLFMNTRPFYTHDRIIYLDKQIDVNYKTMFINTCDAMLHGRKEGETFGLAIAEFSMRNKPVITCPCGDLEHIQILGEKGLFYKTKEDLLKILTDLPTLIKSREDWNAYRDYNPKAVMDIFKRLCYE
jgi:hypothetical protein